MDIKQLLEKMEEFAGEKVGQKPGDQWRGSDKAPPGKKLVGDSILKDLSKGQTPKSKEQELSEEFQAFLEAEFKDTVDKRPSRKGSRPARGHEPKSGYKTVKADEGAMSEKDIELQDYRSMSHKEFQTAYGMTKTEWINKNKALVIQNPSIKKALGLEEGVGQVYTVLVDRQGIKPVTGTMEELLHYFRHFLHQGRIYEKGLGYGVGRHKINMEPKNVQQLVDELNKAATNIVPNRPPPIRFMVGQSQVAEGVPYKATNKDPASKDPVVAKVLKQMRPGLKGLEMNNEAFLYFAYELGKQRARGMWEKYGPAIKHFYQSGIGVNEANDNNAVEARWMVKVSDDEGDHLKTFRDEFPNLAAAKKAYEKHKPYASDFKYTSVKKEQVEEAVDTFNRAGFNPISDERDYLDKLSKLSNLYRQQGLDQSMKAEIFQRINDLNAEARTKGYIQAESRGHNVISTKLKNLERERKFASGELKIPTPQERQSQLKKLEKEPKQVKEYGANNVSPYGQPTQKVDPKQAQQVAANLNVQKTALNQLKQINPEIDPQKAATAMTKDLATMSPQEKEELAQIGKTVSPALGTPAFGSIKTAIQKSQIK
jgi:hypothetical protein